MLSVIKPGVSWTIALAVLAASLFGLWRVLPENAEVRLTGETLTALAQARPPKRWRGFETEIQNIAIDGDVRITARVSGYLIHTPVEIAGAPEYDAARKAMFFHVSKVRLPDEARRPILRRFNKMLNPLATYVARHVMNVIPARKFKSDTRGGFVFLTTVKSVRVEGDAVVVSLHGVKAAWKAVPFLAGAALAAVWLIFASWRRWRRREE